MKKILLLSLLVLFGCSKESENSEEEIVDDRPLIERLTYRAYGVEGEKNEFGAYGIEGFYFRPTNDPKIETPIVRKYSSFSTENGLLITTGCYDFTKLLHSSKSNWLSESWEVLQNEKNKYVALWKISDRDFKNFQEYKIQLESQDIEQSLRVKIELLILGEIKDSFDWTGKFIGINRNSKCDLKF